mgnify:FL=1
MTARVLDIGNCVPDHTALTTMISQNFGVDVVQAHGRDDACEQLAKGDISLILINRILDRDGSDGLEILKELKADENYASIPAMLITNFPEHQQAAVAAGAVEGFGKLALHEPNTVAKLRPYLTSGECP